MHGFVGSDALGSVELNYETKCTEIVLTLFFLWMFSQITSIQPQRRYMWAHPKASFASTGICTSVDYLHAALMMGHTEKANLFDWWSFAQLAAWGSSCKEPRGRAGRVQTATDNDVPGAVSARQERVGAQKPSVDVPHHSQGQYFTLHRIGVHLCGRPAGSTAPSGHN